MEEFTLATLCLAKDMGRGLMFWRTGLSILGRGEMTCKMESAFLLTIKMDPNGKANGSTANDRNGLIILKDAGDQIQNNGNRASRKSLICLPYFFVLVSNA